jgi:hypothetical protein
MRSNHLKQKTAEVGQVEDKENVSRNQTEAQTENTTANPEVQDKGYHKEGYVEPQKEEKELTEEEKLELAKKLEDEAIERIIERSKSHRQMCFLNLQSDVFKIY